MKSVLISIQPKWCELIASGKKTVEVRKTRPKLETPFKVYIYCTQARKPIKEDGRILLYEDDLAITNRWGQGKKIENPHGCLKEGELLLNVKVIGEFVCDKMLESFLNNNDGWFIEKGCLTQKEIDEYQGDKAILYGWHISDLVIYDKPKELYEFQRPCNNDCDNCEYLDVAEVGAYEHTAVVKTCLNIITRPPQSWCYVEGESTDERD